MLQRDDRQQTDDRRTHDDI